MFGNENLNPGVARGIASRVNEKYEEKILREEMSVRIINILVDNITN